MSENRTQSFDDNLKRLIAAAAGQIVTRIDELAAHSETDFGLTRTFCSSAMQSAHRDMSKWMHATGMQVKLDAAGNLIGTTSDATDRPIFMVGSHLDTVVNAGKYDGMLGVLLGLAAVAVLTKADLLGELAFDLHVVGFSEEEGVRYQLPFIGSMGIAGCLNPELLTKSDDQGIELATALHNFGCEGNAQTASYANRNLIAFLEPHIEQAIALEESGLAVGIVTAIAGQTRASISFSGKAGHAGTTEHHLRKDALAASAEFILLVEQLGQQTDGLYATVGNINISPGLSNVICGNTELRLDLRHADDSVREKKFAELQDKLTEIATTRGVSVKFENIQHSPAVPMDDKLTTAIESAVVASGSETVKLVSGAGHDAMILAQIAPVGMLFVRCRNGTSHHPDEFVSPEDIAAALTVTVGTILKFAGHNIK